MFAELLLSICRQSNRRKQGAERPEDKGSIEARRRRRLSYGKEAHARCQLQGPLDGSRIPSANVLCHFPNLSDPYFPTILIPALSDGDSRRVYRVLVVLPRIFLSFSSSCVACLCELWTSLG